MAERNDKEPVLSGVDTLLDTPYVRVYDLAYEDGTHYYDASRRPLDRLLAAKDASRAERELPDAISCFVVIETPDDEPRLVLFREYRYPTGRYVLSIPSGLIDAGDHTEEDPIVVAARRELVEETGIELGPDDELCVVNELLFTTPGFTDESTAIVSVVIRRPDVSFLSHAGAEGTERFGRFILASSNEARAMLARGLDDRGEPYPLIAWAAMTFFVCDLWRSEH